MGITLPILNQSASIQVLVTNPALSPVPTGVVVIDFGDGSDPANLTLSESRVETAHTYTALGQFTVTASYAGDTNFAAAGRTLSTVSVVSAPVYLLTEFGDSLTGGTSTSWPVFLTGVLGWTAKSYACAGCKTNDQAPYIYGVAVDDTYTSTWLLGQNDAPTTAAQLSQFQQAVLAENAWLAIPEGAAKLRAQSNAVTQNGSWTNSDLYTTTGLRSVAGGSTLTATVSGSAVYVGLSSLKTTDYTVDVSIDGVDQGTVSPVSVYVGKYQAAEPYGLRYAVGGDKTAAHTVQVVCTDPGTSGCYVDWIGSNGLAARPNLPPYVWTGVSYRTLKDGTGNTAIDKRSAIVRAIEGQLETDGLAIRLADIESVFSGNALPDCSGDGVHPSACGNQIEETVRLSAMTYLATEAQRIDIGAVTPAVVGTPLALHEGSATSGLPVSYTVLSGPGVISAGELTAQQPGVIVIEADQEGSATVLPAASVQFSVAAQAASTTTLTSSASSAYTGSSVTLTATVTAGGSPVSTGTVAFYDGATVLGSAALSSEGVATLTTSALPVGTETLTASYAASAEFLASTSAPITVTILALPQDFTLTESPAALTVKRGNSGSVFVVVTPVNGFNSALSLSCTGLPASTSCAFSAPVAHSDGTSAYTVTVTAAEVTASSTSHHDSGTPLEAILPFALLLLLKRRRRFGRLLCGSAIVLVAVLALAGMSGCTASHKTVPVTATVTITAQTQSGLTHSAQFSLTVD